MSDTVLNPNFSEMFYLKSTLNFGIQPVLVFQLEVYYKIDRLVTGLTAQQKGTSSRWYSNKTSLPPCNCFYFRTLTIDNSDLGTIQSKSMSGMLGVQELNIVNSKIDKVF